MEKTRELFIENITRRRGELGLTQSQVAERVGVTLGTYQKYEYGTAFPTPETIDQLANALVWDVSQLWGAQATEASNHSRAELTLSVQEELRDLTENELKDVYDVIQEIKNLRAYRAAEENKKAE